MIGDIMQPTHLLFVFVIALLVLGPKRLPEVGRQLGNGIRDFRAAISGEHTEDEDEGADGDEDLLAPAAVEPAVEQAAPAPPAENHGADHTITHRDAPADHEFAHSTAVHPTLSSDHQLDAEAAEHSAISTDHELAHEAVERSTVATDHELSNETVEPPTEPIEPVVAHTPPESAAGARAAAPANGDDSFAAEPSAPAENSSDRVA